MIWDMGQLKDFVYSLSECPLCGYVFENVNLYKGVNMISYTFKVIKVEVYLVVHKVSDLS